MPQTEKDAKSLEKLQSSCCNELLCKTVTLSCGHTLCDRCFWETARKATIRDCIFVKCKKCGDTKATTVIAFPRRSQLVDLQSADNCQYFSTCEIHTSKFKIYFCSDHGEALCTDCVFQHRSQNCNTETIENKIKEVKKTADDIFSDQRFKNVSECLCSVDDTDMMLDLFYLKMKKKIRDCKERLARELGISIQDQEIIRHVHDDVHRAYQIVSHNIFTHNTLDELLRIKNSCGSIMYNLKLSEHAEALPTFVASKSKDFEHVLEYDGDPVKLSLVDLSVHQSSSCVEDEETQHYKPSDNSDLQSAVLGETDDYDSDGLNEYDNSFDDSDDNDDGDDKEEEVKEDIEDVTNEIDYDLHDVSLPNQAIAERPKLQSNRPPIKDGGLLKSTDYRRKTDSSWELYSYGTLTDKSISNRDSDSATSISKSTADETKDATSLFKVKTASDVLYKPDMDTVTNYRRSTSESNVAATFSHKAFSPTFSESNTPGKISSRDSDSATSISKSTADGTKDATSLFKVKTASDVLYKPDMDTVTNYRRSTSESNVAATFSHKAFSPTFSESNTPGKISSRDSDSATSISKSTADGTKDATSLFKVKTASDVLYKPDMDTVTNYRRSTSESNVAATFSHKAFSPTFSESNTPGQITSDSTTNRNLHRASSTDVSHSSVKGKPQGEIQSETPNVPILTLSSESSITAVDRNRVSQPGTQSPLDQNIAPTTERSQQNLVREPSSLINFVPGMEIRSQLPQIKEDFSVGQCIGIVISDRFILTSNGKRLQKRRFEDSKLIEDTELSNMTSLCLVPSSGEISILQTNKSIRVYSPAVSKWHFKADITLPYQYICCWKVDRLDSWKTYVFVVSYTNDILQDCINMVTINHYCSFPKSNKECECTTPKDSVLLTSETFPSIRGVNSLDVMSRGQQLLISAMNGLVCVKVSGEEKAEISWMCPFRTNISQIACDDNYVYVCVPNEKRVAKVSQNGEIITANILSTEIVADRIAVKENTVLVGSFFHRDWTCKVYRITF